jgi:hypothetical protein
VKVLYSIRGRGQNSEPAEDTSKLYLGHNSGADFWAPQHEASTVRSRRATALGRFPAWRPVN